VKTLAPEVLALVPNGIENLVLRCVICGEALPPSRRTIGDHTGACHKVRVMYRRYCISLTKCITCLHPSTPEQRKEFNEWRKSRGDLRSGPGKPRKPLDKPEDVSGTPDVALCDAKNDEKPQGIVVKNEAIRGSGASELGTGDHLPPAIEVEPCLAIPRSDRS
jgi:hypothetical protein